MTPEVIELVVLAWLGGTVAGVALDRFILRPSVDLRIWIYRRRRLNER